VFNVASAELPPEPASVPAVREMVAELTENAARFSPPTTTVNIQSRVYHRAPGAHSQPSHSPPAPAEGSVPRGKQR